MRLRSFPQPECWPLTSALISALLLSGCGGGEDNRTTNAAGAQGTSATAGANSPTPAPADADAKDSDEPAASFHCPAGYQERVIGTGSAGNEVTLATIDKSATFTATAPTLITSNITICVRTIPASEMPGGLAPDVAYAVDLIANGAYGDLLHPQLSVTFPMPLEASNPVLEVAKEEHGTFSYSRSPGSAAQERGQDLVISASALEAGLYVVRIPQSPATGTTDPGSDISKTQAGGSSAGDGDPSVGPDKASVTYEVGVGMSGSNAVNVSQLCRLPCTTSSTPTTVTVNVNTAR